MLDWMLHGNGKFPLKLNEIKSGGVSTYYAEDWILWARVSCFPFDIVWLRCYKE